MRDDTRFVLRCEEVFHDKISAAAAKHPDEQEQAARLPAGPTAATQDHHRHAPEGVCKPRRKEGVPAGMDNFFLPLADRRRS